MQRPSETVYEVDLVVKNLKNQKILPYSSPKQAAICFIAAPGDDHHDCMLQIVAVWMTSDSENKKSGIQEQSEGD